MARTFCIHLQFSIWLWCLNSAHLDELLGSHLHEDLGELLGCHLSKENTEPDLLVVGSHRWALQTKPNYKEQVEFNIAITGT